jgi:xanthine dehydrogenase YagR molybdenum-binding subunit
MNMATVGQPMPRVDARLKVTGNAKYAAEFDLPNVAHAIVVTSTIASGRIGSLDTKLAERTAGVLSVITHLTARRLACREHKSVLDPEGERLHVLQDDVVRFNGQPMALVVADTLDQAEYAASLVRIKYIQEPARADFADAVAHTVPPAAGLRPDSTTPADTRRGDLERAFADAAARLDAHYGIARQQHNPIEPHATIARWDDDSLTLWDKTQWVGNVRDELAAVFGIAPEQVHVISPFVGGAFGTTLRAWPYVTWQHSPRVRSDGR